MSDENDQQEVEAATPDAIICIDPIDFDPSRVVVKDPQLNEFTLKSGAVIKTCTSPGKYLDDEGKECTLYFRGDPQQTFGFSYNHEISIAKEDRTPDNASGVQVSYPLTSMTTVQNPKPTEQALEDLFMGLWQAVVDKGREEIEKDETTLPAVATSSFVAASKKGQWERAVKIPFAHPKDKNDKKKFDTTKPKSIYTKLVTTGRGTTMKVQTIVHGPGDRVQSALRYIDTPGILTPVWVWEGAYHGAHGNEASYGTSLRFKLVQCNFVPKSFSRIPQNRMLPRNTAPVEEDDTYPPARGRGANHNSDGGDAGQDDDAFSAPGEDSSNPAAALASATKAKAGAKAPVAKAKPAPTGKAPAKAKAVLAKGKAPAKGVAKAPVKAPAKAPVAKGKAKPAPVKAKPKVQEPEDEPEEVEEEEENVEDEE